MPPTAVLICHLLKLTICMKGGAAKALIEILQSHEVRTITRESTHAMALASLKSFGTRPPSNSDKSTFEGSVAVILVASNQSCTQAALDGPDRVGPITTGPSTAASMAQRPPASICVLICHLLKLI